MRTQTNLAPRFSGRRLPAASAAVCIVQPEANVASETFLRTHAERLPQPVFVVHGFPPHRDGEPPWRGSVLPRPLRKAGYRLAGTSAQQQTTSALVSVFRAMRPRVVLAEYGPTGVAVAPACRRMAIPLVVHFHGYDASRRDVLATYEAGYRDLFRQAVAIVVVSEPMRAEIIALGADPARVFRNPCGVDCRAFSGAAPAAAAPVLLAVGRLVEKKGPQFTITAFQQAHARVPHARLRIIGEGPLRQVCADLVRRLGLDQAVTFLGTQAPAVVQQEMRMARAFVQHSVRAPSGDSEGLPVAILEASAAGLPCVSTRHAGIPEAVIDGESGLLVDEQDVPAMADRMTRLLLDSGLAGRMGQRAQAHVREHFSVERSIAGLGAILDACAAPQAVPPSW